MRNKYASLEGMYFQTPGSDIENQLNTRAAVDIIRRYITEGGHQTDVEEAIDWLEDEFPKCRPITRDLRNFIFIDDLFGFDEKSRICGHYYNRLIKRLS